MEAAIADALDWNRMDTDSSQLGSPPAWIHIDNQATRATEANPSHHYEESQVYGSTSKTARGEGVEGLKTTGLDSDTVSI
jgi:PKD repeat protein